jgi:hypothetical protein
MKLTESKLRYIIRDLINEGIYDEDEGADADGDGTSDKEELLKIAANMGKHSRDVVDRQRSRHSVLGDLDKLLKKYDSTGSDADLSAAEDFEDKNWDALSQSSSDMADLTKIGKGGMSFMDWAQTVVDVSSTMTGIEDIEDGYDPDTGEQIMPYDAWLKGADPAIYAQSIDLPGAGDERSDDFLDKYGDRIPDDLYEMGILPGGKLGKLLREAMRNKNNSVTGIELIDEATSSKPWAWELPGSSLPTRPHPADHEDPDHGWLDSPDDDSIYDDGWRDDPALPSEFVGDNLEAYINRPQLTQKMSDLEYGPDSAPEDILAIALSNRAEELGGYKRTIDPHPFKELAMRIYQNYIVSKAGDPGDSLSDITTKIDAGGYFDEDIDDVPGWKNLLRAPDALTESRLMHLAGIKED